jgi:butyryl-CoA dehydrogenase
MRKLPLRMQDSLFHDLILPEETREIKKEVREFAEKEIQPVAYQIGQQEEDKENFPWTIFNKMAKQGLFQIPYPSKYGGRGLKYPVCATCVTLEELAYISDSIAAIYDVHCILAGHALMYGSEEMKKKYLRQVALGERVGCFATTEPNASSELSVRSLRTTAEKKGNKWIVNGQKRFITNAPVGGFVATLCVTDGKLTEMLVDLDAEGVRIGEPDKKIGNRGQLTADIYLDNVEVPEKNIIGKIGQGLHIALGTLTYGRVGVGASGVGMAQSAFDESVAYMKEREAFGKKIAQFQYWQFRLAERTIQIENARNLYSKAAFRMDQGAEFPEPEASGAKYYGTNCAAEMARDAVQIFGGYGFLRRLGHDQSTYKVEEIYRDCKITEIYEGTNEIQKYIIAREIFERE